MPALSRRTVIAAGLSVLAAPALAGGPPAADRLALIRSYGFINLLEDVEASFDTPFGRATVAAFVEGLDRHHAGRACPSAPVGPARTEACRALLVDMAKAYAGAGQAALRLDRAYERLVRGAGREKAEAMLAALADPAVRGYIALGRRSRQANFLEDVVTRLQREFVARGTMDFSTTESNADPELFQAFIAETDQTEAQARETEIGRHPPFRTFLAMWDPMSEAVTDTRDRAAATRFAGLSLSDLFRDRLAALCIG